MDKDLAIKKVFIYNEKVFLLRKEVAKTPLKDEHKTQVLELYLETERKIDSIRTEVQNMPERQVQLEYEEYLDELEDRRNPVTPEQVSDNSFSEQNEHSYNLSLENSQFYYQPTFIIVIASICFIVYKFLFKSKQA